MKKVICFLSAVLLLAGCGGVSKPPELDKAMTMTADISYGNMTAAAKLSRVADGSWQAVMMSPYALEGMTITLDGTNAKAELNGVTAKFDVGDGISAITAVTDALETAIHYDENEGTSCACADGGVIISGKDFSVTVTADNGAPVCLEAGEVSAQFGEVTVSDFCEEFDAMLEE